MKRLLAVNLSMTLIFALGLISCDKDKKLTGPTEPSPAGQATSQPVAKATTQATSDGICDRPQPVQDAILSQLSMSNCAEVSTSDLASITGSLSLTNKGLTEVPSGTFAGLTRLQKLYLERNELSALPADVFDGLGSLRSLDLDNNALAALPADVFDGLTELRELDLHGNALAALPADVFDGLTKLEYLNLSFNALAALPADVFDGLTKLENLDLMFNALAALPADVFDGLTKLEKLRLMRNALSTLPADIFDGLTKLEELWLTEAGLSSLPAGVFDGLDNLNTLSLGHNDLEALPADVFDDLDNLKLLDLRNNDLEALPADVFDDLGNLEDLDVGFNDIDLDELPSDFFDAFPELKRLSLLGIGRDLKDLEGDNTGTMTTLSYDWFDSLSELEYLDLRWNELSTLPADIFDGFTKLKYLDLNNNDLEALPGNSELEDLPGGLFKGLSNLESVDLGNNPGAPFTVTAELEQLDDAVVVKVADGAPYAMAVRLSAEGGTLSSRVVTVAGGSLESRAINVTPNGQRPTQVTVRVESAAFKKKIDSDKGIRAGVGESLTLIFRALANSPAMGTPTISGKVQVGETLRADTADIEDADGVGHASFSYQWIANDGSTDTDIPGATGASYTLVAADAGKTIKVRVSFTDDAGNEETLTITAAGAVDHEEPVVAWSATLTVGVDASTIPATSGYSLWGDMGGTISTERFTLDGATYRVIFLMHYADGLYFGINGKLATDFTLRIGDAEYTAQESSTPNSLVEEAYWWGAKDFNWTAGDQVEVSLTPVPGTGSALPDRPPAPLTAHFRFAPESHNGVDDFTFRTYFSEDISIRSTTFRDHSFVVSGGSVIAAKKVNGSNRIWEITVAPNSSDDVTIALPADRACEEEGTICADDGRPLYNQPELTVPGREEVEQEEVSEEVIPAEEEEPLEADAAATESDDHVKKPASVRKPWATNITHNSARIEWQKASRAEEYVVLRRALYADHPESSLSPIATISGLSYDDTDLVPQTEYIYRIVARNNVGDANRSPHVKFRTLSEP